MTGDRVETIENHPKFKELVDERGRFATMLSIVMLAIYLGFILLIAFAPGLLGIKLGGAMTLGIPIGLAVIVSAFVLTGIYVARANGRFDALNEDILRETR